MLLTWLLLGLPCGGCDAPSAALHEVRAGGTVDIAEASAEALARAGWGIGTSSGGKFTAAWRPVAGAVPVNELFEIEVLLFEGSLDGHGERRETAKPLCGAKVQVSAWMPEHMHGMNRRPQTVETAPGRYLVRGMLLHMEGAWQLFIDVMMGSVSERAEFAITLR